MLLEASDDPPGVRVFVGLDAVGMRWSFDRLAGAALGRIGYEARCGARFIYFGKRRDAAHMHGELTAMSQRLTNVIAERNRVITEHDVAAAHGIFPRIDEALDFAKNTRVLLLVHRPSKIEIDLSLGMLPFESDLVHRARAVDVGEVRFPLAAPEDVIVMKALALRPRDVADIEGIVESNAELDLDRVRSTLSQLSAALESDDHLSRLDEILRSVRR